MLNKIQKTVQKFKNNFDKKNNLSFVSSFQLQMNQTHSVIRNILLRKIHKNHFSKNLIEKLIENYFQKQNDFTLNDHL